MFNNGLITLVFGASVRNGSIIMMLDYMPLYTWTWEPSRCTSSKKSAFRNAQIYLIRFDWVSESELYFKISVAKPSIIIRWTDMSHEWARQPLDTHLPNYCNDKHFNWFQMRAYFLPRSFSLVLLVRECGWISCNYVLIGTVASQNLSRKCRTTYQSSVCANALAVPKS